MSAPGYETGRLPPQSLLRQRYLIIGEVGQGGMGAVYQAIDTRAAHRRVAVKEMSQTHLSEAERAVAETRFQSEAALLASLAHPHLPRVYEAFSERGRLYLIMDFIEGKTLFRLLEERSGNPLPVAQVLAYADQLCNVLTYLHQHHPPIIFRDLKPANVMVTEHGKIFLIDFGIARLFKTGQQQDTIFLGSPGYAPPEQHGISQTNPRSDLYSLGVTLHYCLTAREPSFARDRFLFPPARQYNLQVPEELDHLIQRLVAIDERQRPASAVEVRQVLLYISQQSVAPTEQLASALPATQYVSPASIRRLPAPSPASAISVNSSVPPVALGQAIPPQAPFQRSQDALSASVWTLPFTTLFGLLLALTVGGSSYAFNFIIGSDHLVEFSLSLVLLLVLLGAAGAVRTLMAWSILGLASLPILVMSFAFLEQSLYTPTTSDQQASVATPFQADTLNQLLTIGLAGAALAALLWLARPFPWRDRLVFLVVFLVPLGCALLQYGSGDGVVAKHILLLVGVITLIQGLVLAAQVERIHQRRSFR